MSDPSRPELDDMSLDALFAEARDTSVPSEALMDRIVADAAVVAKPEVIAVPKVGLWTQMMEAVGGWPSLSGLATATIAGVYIGFSDPTLLETVGLTEVSEAAGDVLFGDDVFFDDLTVGEG